MYPYEVKEYGNGRERERERKIIIISSLKKIFVFLINTYILK